MLIEEIPFETQTVLNVMGMPCRTIVSGAMTNRKLAIVYFEVERAGMGVPEHTHDLEDETFHILEGKVRVTLGDKEIIATAGQTVFGPRNVRHSWFALEPSKLVVSATPSGLEEMFIEINALGEAQRDVENVFAVCKRYAIHFT
jgi:quercetin dioxygenase-like cupin family protein